MSESFWRRRAPIWLRVLLALLILPVIWACFALTLEAALPPIKSSLATGVLLVAGAIIAGFVSWIIVRKASSRVSAVFTTLTLLAYGLVSLAAIPAYQAYNPKRPQAEAPVTPAPTIEPPPLALDEAPGPDFDVPSGGGGGGSHHYELPAGEAPDAPWLDELPVADPPPPPPPEVPALEEPDTEMIVGGQKSALLPEFPWPPPAASASYVLPDKFFEGYRTVGEVTAAILAALEENGYVERSFFRTAPGGVAMVTRLERINNDGSPSAARWPAIAQPVGSTRSLLDFLHGLFFVDPGHYRVIVFVLQDLPFSQSAETITAQQAHAWLPAGANVLPREIAKLSFDGGHVTVLIYEFASDGSKVQVVPSRITGKQHLEKGPACSPCSTKPLEVFSTFSHGRSNCYDQAVLQGPAAMTSTWRIRVLVGLRAMAGLLVLGLAPSSALSAKAAETFGGPASVLAYHQNNLAIAKRLAESDPGNAALQRLLSLAYMHLGDAYAAQGNPTEAPNHYREGLAVAEHASKADPATWAANSTFHSSTRRSATCLLRGATIPRRSTTFSGASSSPSASLRPIPAMTPWLSNYQASYRRVSEAHRNLVGYDGGLSSGDEPDTEMGDDPRAYGPTKLPEFPWPPSQTSASYVLPNSLLRSYRTIGGVTAALLSALETNGYVERSFYRTTPGGVALVTRLERINDDGSPVAESARWPASGQRHDSTMGLMQFLRGLFFVDPGHYRVIVFVLQGPPFTQSEKNITADEARTWLRGGANVLPSDIAAIPFRGAHCTVLVYEFASDGTKVQVVPSRITGKQHLEKAGVLAVLDQRQ